MSAAWAGAAARFKEGHPLWGGGDTGAWVARGWGQEPSCALRPPSDPGLSPADSSFRRSASGHCLSPDEWPLSWQRKSRLSLCVLQSPPCWQGTAAEDLGLVTSARPLTQESRRVGRGRWAQGGHSSSG